MKKSLEEIRKKALLDLKGIKDLDNLDDIRVKYLGKKGELTEVMKGMRDVPKEERPIIGKLANEVRSQIESELGNTKAHIEKILLEKKLKEEVIDVTMPGKKVKNGSMHILNKVKNDIQDIFLGLGYSIAEGPDVELDYYNFEALNIPENHPAKDEQDTFYINEDVVLRTQTSPVQIRVMEDKKPPIKILSPGRVFRSDDIDATHSPVFHQIEGLVVDKEITMADLKGTLALFAKKTFGDNVKIKFRPHHFPFTEPSAEVDVSCFKCHGEDENCKICKGSGWIEILGCGMVHPNVLEKVGIDTNEYSGFAFGMGLERIAMLKYGIEDLRLFYENDVRFLKQFK